MTKRMGCWLYMSSLTSSFSFSLYETRNNTWRRNSNMRLIQTYNKHIRHCLNALKQAKSRNKWMSAEPVSQPKKKTTIEIISWIFFVKFAIKRFRISKINMYNVVKCCIDINSELARSNCCNSSDTKENATGF